MRSILTVVVVAAIILGFFALGSWITMILWGILASYFGFKTISFGIAVVITIVWASISSVITGSNK